MSGAPGEPTVRVVGTLDEVFDVAAEAVAEALIDAIGRRGRADWATAGGSTVPGIYRRLAAQPLRGRVAWSAVHVWFGDDRFVPRDHPLSNVLPIDQGLVGSAAYSGQSGRGESGIDIAAGLEEGAMIPVENIHAMPIGDAIGESRDPDWAAARYDAWLHEAAFEGQLDVADGFPAFDLVLVGIGPDGHLLSVFPASAAWSAEAWAMGVPAPTHVEPRVARITLHPAILARARVVIVVATGTSKADAIARALGEPGDVLELPAQAARLARATWILDGAAAARLPG